MTIVRFCHILAMLDMKPDMNSKHSAYSTIGPSTCWKRSRAGGGDLPGLHADRWRRRPALLAAARAAVQGPSSPGAPLRAPLEA
jgi:hypothetical protein